MRRFFTFFGVLGLCGLVSTRGDAQTTALIAVDDATQIAELQLAKVMAEDSSLWLSVRLRGHSRLALVTAESASESAVAADAWLRALDFATRMRVAPPPGPLASCGSLTQFELSDSGAPESQRILASEIVSETSELGLRRRLADFGLPVDVSRVAQFTGRAQPPFRVALYDAPAFGGNTDALRLVDRGHSEELPIIETSGTSTLPVSAILLAKSGVQPVVQGSADASEFPVSYRLVDASSDYLSARANWLAQNPERWLNEVQDGAALFSGTVFPTGDRLASVVSRYLSGLPDGATGACLTKFRAAHERSSTNAADFACDDADDLAQALTELDFAEPRLNRFHGIIGADGERFRIASDGSHTPLLFATDFDQSGCSQPVTPPVSGANPPMSPPVATTPVVVSTPVEPDDTPIPNTTAGTYSEVSCTGSVADSSSNDSCSGDSSSSESSSDDSCSGDSSSSESSSDDSCSGDSSSSESSSDDSCSGDSSSSESSSDDSCSGDSSSSESSSDSCNGSSSDSEYDGDTCSGNSAGSNPSRAKSAALRVDTAGRSSPRRAPHQRPRHVRLSLLTWLVAALALPLRRLSASR